MTLVIITYSGYYDSLYGEYYVAAHGRVDMLHTHTCSSTRMHNTCLRTLACVRACTCMRAHTHRYKCMSGALAHMHICRRTHLRPFKPAGMCVSVSMRACVRACGCVCVCVCVSGQLTRLHKCIHVSMHGSIWHEVVCGMG